jgi:hypothetical protein
MLVSLNFVFVFSKKKKKNLQILSSGASLDESRGQFDVLSVFLENELMGSFQDAINNATVLLKGVAGRVRAAVRAPLATLSLSLSTLWWAGACRRRTKTR